MNMQRSRSIKLAAGAVCMVIGHWTFAQDTGVVAQVNGQTISGTVLERAVRQQAAMGRADTPELRARIRDELIAQELLYQEAVRLKLDESPDFVTAMDNARRAALATLALQTAKPQPVTDAEVRAAYEKSRAGLLGQDFHLRAIVVTDQDVIKQVRSALAKGASFEELAARHSKLPSARMGGDLGWLNVREAKSAGGPLPEAVAAEVRKLSLGSITAPVADGSGGWWMVKLEEQRPIQVVNIEQAAGRIRQTLEAAAGQKAAADLLKQLRQSAKIQR